MNHRARIVVSIGAASVVFAAQATAAIVFRPGEKVKLVSPGEEEMNGTAQELFQKAQASERKGDIKGAAKAYRRIVKRYPKDALSPGAAFRCAELEEQAHDYLRAAGDFRYVVERYSQSPNFNQAIEAQFRIGNIYLNGKKQKILGIPVPTSLDNAVEIFAAIVRTAPYGKYTARAQFSIGLAREKQGLNDAAVAAYQAVVDKFPNDPVAADAQYQIGYIYYAAAKAGTKDQNAARLSKTGFQDFLYRYPRSEKASQARENMNRLEHKQTNDAYAIAKFYDKKKNYRAAAIYYNDVIRQQPGSQEAQHAKQRIDQLRPKVGDAALKQALASAPPSKPKRSQSVGPTERGNSPTMRGAAADVAPLPPADSDASLPPPASLTPDTTTAPDSSPAPSPSPGSSP